MPFVRVDQEAFDDMLGELDPSELPEGVERPSGGFEYETAEGTFRLANLAGSPRFVYDALMARGAHKFRVRYDGGYDEGFAHPDYVEFEGGDRRVTRDLVDELAKTPLGAALRAEWDKRPHSSAPEWSDAHLVAFALDELGHQMACRLLGDGYGTGEYQLYGAFVADLKTGELTDDPEASKPAEME